MKIAVIQLKIKKDKTFALNNAIELIKKASKKKPEIIILPELFLEMWDLKSSSKSANHKTFISEISKLAKKYKTTIIAGSVFEKNKNKKPFNTCFIFNSNEKLITKYRKIHLFDLNKIIPSPFPLPLGERARERVYKIKYSESSFMQNGKKPIIFKYKNHRIGLAICNDLRYPEMFRSYALKNAFATIVVSAFTHFTGKSHWHLLNRCRAVENQMYIFSANMCGKNKDGMKFYGHSLIIDPWGKILAEASEKNDEIIYADINQSLVYKLRKELPTLKKVRKHY